MSTETDELMRKNMRNATEAMSLRTLLEAYQPFQFCKPKQITVQTA